MELIKTAKDMYEHGCRLLKEHEPNCYTFEISQILEHVCGISKAYLPLKGDTLLSTEHQNLFNDMLNRRLAFEPLQYILGSWEFYGLPMKVGEGVLIPRSDTEALVETALELIGANQYKLCADLCSGSGAIAIAISKNSDIEKMYALELSNEALPYLTENVKMNNVCDVVEVISDDVLNYSFATPLDLIVSNPPYIPKLDIPTLEPEVLNEPYIALCGGEDGLNFYRQIAKSYAEQIRPGGAIVFEVGIHQHGKVMEILKANGYCNIAYKTDLCNIPRVVYGFK